MTTHLILLAAGQGTRMQSDRPKVLHEIGGLPLIVHALRSAENLAPERRVVVVGHGADEVGGTLAAFDPEAIVVQQKEQLGTGHAVAQTLDALAGAKGDALVLYGDTPFIGIKTLARMSEARNVGHELVVLGFEARDPGRYGRLVTEGEKLLEIVEWKDATEAQRQINLCNSGIMLCDLAHLFDLVAALSNENASGEYYLTDIVSLATARGLSAAAIFCDEDETLGVNSRGDLAIAEGVFQAQKRAEALATGVTLRDPASVHFSHDTVIGRDAVIEPYVVFGPGVTVESGAAIRAFSHLEGCHVGRGVTIGPFARLRPGAEIGNGARVGNFCEVKNAEIGEGAKVNHLSYVGDASVGDDANIGAGTITCNYDGVSKHRTEIGARAFIGSNTMLVAPVTVGTDAMTASGTVVTRDVPDGALAISRVPQETRSGFAIRLMNKLKAVRTKTRTEN